MLKQSEITVSNILESYINNGRYIGKAGGFGIQDRDFFLVVRQVMGNPMTIVGLPVEIIFDILKDFNVPMKYFDFLNKYWPSQIEQRKIFPVAKKEEYVSKKRDALSRQETEYAEEIKKVKDSFDPGKSEQLINLYCKLILALQYAYRLWDAVKYVEIMKDDKGVKLSPAVLRHLDVVLNKFNTKTIDKGIGITIAFP